MTPSASAAMIGLLPPVLGPPVGPTILDLPIRVPLPAKITISVGQPIDLRAKLVGTRSRRRRTSS